MLRDDDYIYVVLPFCNGGELFSVVSATRGLSEDAARPIFRGLLAGMAFLHSLHICHRYFHASCVLQYMHAACCLLHARFANTVRQFTRTRIRGKGVCVWGVDETFKTAVHVAIGYR